MSKGTARVILRLDEETIDLVREEALRSKNSATQEPYSLSSWIRHAIQEKLNKLRRARGEETVMRKPLPGDDGTPVAAEVEGGEG